MIPFVRYCYVAETEERARENSRAGLDWTLDVAQWRRAFRESSEVYHSLGDWRQSGTELPPSYDYFVEHQAVIGAPDQCVTRVRDLQAQGIEYFGRNFFFGDISHRNALRSVELFAREVMPAFRLGLLEVAS